MPKNKTPYFTEPVLEADFEELVRKAKEEVSDKKEPLPNSRAHGAAKSNKGESSRSSNHADKKSHSKKIETKKPIDRHNDFNSQSSLSSFDIPFTQLSNHGTGVKARAVAFEDPQERLRVQSMSVGLNPLMMSSTLGSSLTGDLYPRGSEVKNSIVKVLVTAQEHDYETPLSHARKRNWHGSGFIIQHEGEFIIITNAHVAADHSYIQVLKAGTHQKFKAELEYIHHECDLAILRVNDPKFFHGVKPLKISEKLFLTGGDSVSVKGFPCGGEEISETFGRVSRIEIGEYVERGQELIHIQVDAAINPGNSGGPVFENDEIVGIAFQGDSSGESLGYIIPNIILKHFLEDRVKDPLLRGFPDFPIEYQYLENKYQRAAYGLTGIYESAGVLVLSIPPLFTGSSVLQKYDVIVKVNGRLVNHDGTINYDWAPHVSMLHEFSIMGLGDEVSLTIIRQKKEIEVRYKLGNRFGDSFYVGPTRYDRAPTFLIESGFVFAPVVENNIGFVQDESYEGAPIDVARKKEATQEIIYIANILPGKKLEGYESAEGHVVKKINGIDIKNMPHLVQVFNDIAEGAPIEIILANSQILHLNKYTRLQVEKMIKAHDLHKFCSNDLLPETIADYFIRSIVNKEEPSRYLELFRTRGLNAAYLSTVDNDDSDLELDESSDEEYLPSSKKSKRVILSSEESEDLSESLDDLSEEDDSETDLSGFIDNEEDEGYEGLPSDVRNMLTSIAKRQAISFSKGKDSHRINEEEVDRASSSKDKKRKREL